MHLRVLHLRAYTAYKYANPAYLPACRPPPILTSASCNAGDALQVHLQQLATHRAIAERVASEAPDPWFVINMTCVWHVVGISWCGMACVWHMVGMPWCGMACVWHVVGMSWCGMACVWHLVGMSWCVIACMWHMVWHVMVWHVCGTW
jgi:hypothetical protein